MNKILILKNDRVGDLFNSLDGINAILKDNPKAKVEIILSEISRNLSFLFNINNVTVSYLPYHLTLADKFKLLSALIVKLFPFSEEILSIVNVVPLNVKFALSCNSPAVPA